MLATTFSIVALAASLVSAVPMEPVIVIDQAPSFGNAFGIEATGEGLGTAPVQLTAQRGRVYIGGTQEQPTNCSSAQTVHDFATFVWYSDKTIFLYSNDPTRPQQVWADVGNGGIVGYATAKQANPGPESLSPFEIDAESRIVTFDGVSAKACPEDSEKPTTAPFGIWFSTEEKPGNLANCFDVTLKAYATPARDACTYSYLPSCEEEPDSCGPFVPSV